MQEVTTIQQLRGAVHTWRRSGESVAFVPTMGNLHAGHMHLVDQARLRAQRVVASIFVNPLQFGPKDDFARYPRTIEQDRQQLSAHGADLLFLPSVEEMYPVPLAQTTKVAVPELSDVLCGASRPGHFVGVATVVARLFNIVQPDVALFGEKDFQQVRVIQRMVRDLAFPIEIVSVPTVRDADGLALSSRNGYLSEAERATAPRLSRALQAARERLRRGDRDFAQLETAVRNDLVDAGFKPDYISIRRVDDLAEPGVNDADLVILAAAWLGTTRLIDNLRVQLPG